MAESGFKDKTPSAALLSAEKFTLMDLSSIGIQDSVKASANGIPQPWRIVARVG